MAFEFKFPDVGEGIHEGKIVKWLVKEGDNVAADQSIAEVETDKAIVEIPSPRHGKILKLTHQEGETIEVGEVLVVIEEAQSAAGSPQTADNNSSSTTQNIAASPEPMEKEEKKESVGVVGSLEDTAPGVMKAPSLSSSGAVFGGASSTSKQEAAQSTTQANNQFTAKSTTQPVSQTSAQLTTPTTTQSNSQTTTQPTTQSAEQTAKQIAQQATSPVANKSTGVNVVKSEFKAVKKYDLFGYIDRAPYDGIRKAIGNQMVKSATAIPHVTHMDIADITELAQLREKEKSKAEEQGIKLTFLPFFIKAAIAALQKHPFLNASLEEENSQIILKKYYNIGLAVDTEAGLMVPVIKGADKKNILQLAKEIVELAEKARSRKINPMDMKGGTFTVTNIGSAGSGLFFTPVINHPEAAILGIGTITDTPVAYKGKTAIRKVVGLSLSFDHRILDGAEAARFVKTLKDHLQDPGELLVELGG